MLLLQANGGTNTLDETRRAPLVLDSSGPSAGVVADAEVAGQAGFSDAICGDAVAPASTFALIADGLRSGAEQPRLAGVSRATREMTPSAGKGR